MRTRFSGLAALFACSLVAPVSAQPSCQPNIAPAALNGRRPVEIDPGVHPCGFLQFAWQDFIALNWPPVAPNPNNTTARARGLPDSGKVIGQGANDNPTVWEQSQPNWYLFWANNPPAAAVDGKSFAAWNQDAWLPAACGPLKLNLPAGAAPPRILSSLSKFDGMPGVVQASSAPLIDQNGFYTRYEILMDYPAFNYINSNRFYLLPRVQAFAQNGQPFNFPVQSGNTPGATFLKAAWKPLLAADINSGRYHTAQAFLYTPAFGNVSASCAGPVPVGLVGLHIVHKTQDFPQWMWATFEHIDNTPADPALPGLPPPQGWSFFSPGSTKTPNQGAKCPDGTSPAGACDFQPTSSHMGTNPNDRTGGPTQASRLNPIQKSQNQPALGEINAAVQTALKQINPNTVWQFYQLVEAQWQSEAPPQPPCTAKTGFFPACRVANMVMETYTQRGSCMACHKPATAPFRGSPQVESDLTFELDLAWALPPPLPASRVPALAPGGVR